MTCCLSFYILSNILRRKLPIVFLQILTCEDHFVLRSIIISGQIVLDLICTERYIMQSSCHQFGFQNEIHRLVQAPAVTRQVGGQCSFSIKPKQEISSWYLQLCTQLRGF
ncbi:Hypothetical_protein [Hexamita inflata]|uniref:Hypothetical_protein n=1 Tax=Hexamita inflata TaxID=28002 RepID=A0ABP1KRI8_9EUKA